MSRHAKLWGPSVLAVLLMVLVLAGTERSKPERMQSAHFLPPSPSSGRAVNRATGVLRDLSNGAESHEVRARAAAHGAPSKQDDLYEVFAANVGSADPRLLRAAARAFKTCVPAFLPAQGQEPSPEPLIRALPPAHDPERDAAYWVLYGRCSALLALSRQELIDTWQAMERNQRVREPGRLAEEALVAGEEEKAADIVARTLRGDDPAAIASLAGLASRIVVRHDATGSGASRQQQAAAVDAALPLVACDLGADCSAGSVQALQLCAVQGLCSGDAKDRLIEQARRTGSDGTEVGAQRARLLALIRTGSSLGVVDLLP